MNGFIALYRSPVSILLTTTPAYLFQSLTAPKLSLTIPK